MHGSVKSLHWPVLNNEDRVTLYWLSMRQSKQNRLLRNWRRHNVTCIDIYHVPYHQHACHFPDRSTCFFSYLIWIQHNSLCMNTFLYTFGFYLNRKHLVGQNLPVNFYAVKFYNSWKNIVFWVQFLFPIYLFKGWINRECITTKQWPSWGT